MTGRPVQFKKRTQLVVVSLTVFYWLGIWTLFESVPLFFQAGAQTLPAPIANLPANPPAPRESATEIDLKSKDLDRQIAFMEKRLDYIEKLLAALVSVGTIFGLALGLTSYLNAKDLQQSAEKALEKVKDAADKELTDIRADFPAIARLNHRITDILNDISVFGNLKLDELDGKGYDQLKPSEKQEILLQEMTFSALNCFDHARSPDLKDSAASVNIVLGRFYGSRFHFDPVNNSPDLPRAIVYNIRGLETGEKEILRRANGALGVLHLWQSHYEKDPQKQEKLRLLARGYYEATQVPGITDPKRLVALAWLDRREGHVDRSIQQLNEVVKALEDNKLPAREVARFSEVVYTNRGCYRAQEKQFDAAMLDLWKAKAAAANYQDLDVWLKNLARECAPAGDLFEMMSDAAYSAELTRMLLRDSRPPE